MTDLHPFTTQLPVIKPETHSTVYNRVVLIMIHLKELVMNGAFKIFIPEYDQPGSQ
jgi:hypothetical protein